MTLAKIREQWEPGLKEILVVIDLDRNVIVLLQNEENEFYVHRYFQIGEDWQISIDWNDIADMYSSVENLQEALNFITERFKKYIPK